MILLQDMHLFETPFLSGYVSAGEWLQDSGNLGHFQGEEPSMGQKSEVQTECILMPSVEHCRSIPDEPYTCLGAAHTEFKFCLSLGK